MNNVGRGGGNRDDGNNDGGDSPNPHALANIEDDHAPEEEEKAQPEEEKKEVQLSEQDLLYRNHTVKMDEIRKSH